MRKKHFLIFILLFQFLGCKSALEASNNDSKLVLASNKQKYIEHFVLIKKGEFIMGRGWDCTNKITFPDVCPTQKIYLDDYYISKYEITNEEYAYFLNEVKPDKSKVLVFKEYLAYKENPKSEAELQNIWIIITSAEEIKNKKFYFFRPSLASVFPAEIYLKNDTYIVRDGFERRPVHTISYLGTQAYCNWLSEEINKEVKLPSEAQWEKAAWGGTTDTIYPWGNEFTGKEANINKNDMNFENSVGTTDVGSFPPNGYGVYDMVGNVSELCRDIYNEYPKKRPYKNPLETEGSTSTSARVVKGSYFSGLTNTEVYGNFMFFEDMPLGYVGFRVVIEK